MVSTIHKRIPIIEQRMFTSAGRILLQSMMHELTGLVDVRPDLTKLGGFDHLNADISLS
jgi:hypothetical protein